MKKVITLSILSLSILSACSQTQMPSQFAGGVRSMSAASSAARSLNLSKQASLPLTVREVSYQPQDIFVMAPASLKLAIKADLSNNQVSLSQTLEPDPQGNYVFPESDARFTGAAAFSSVARAIELFETAYGRPIVWSTGEERLIVHPDEGLDLNAFYTRIANGPFKPGLSFFHSTDQKTGQVVYTGRSGEIAPHEAGHALLDAVRPGYFACFGTEVRAFHEAFGDVMALVTTLQDDRVVERVAEQTGGDLTKNNIASATGEHMGVALNHFVGLNYTGGDWVRNLNNKLQWSPPTSGTGFHDWSKIWSGASYDVLGRIVQNRIQAGQSTRQALRAGAQDLLAMYARLLQPGQAPEGDFTFADMARAWIRAEEQLNNSQYAPWLKEVFLQRKILSPSEIVRGQDAPARGSHWQEIKLPQESRFGNLAGGRVRSLFSGDVRKDPTEPLRLQRQIAEMLEGKEILFTPPGANPTGLSWRKPNGYFYRGIVTWEKGQAVLSPVPAIN